MKKNFTLAALFLGSCFLIGCNIGKSSSTTSGYDDQFNIGLESEFKIDDNGDGTWTLCQDGRCQVFNSYEEAEAAGKSAGNGFVLDVESNTALESQPKPAVKTHEVDSTAKKWFTKDRKSYYLPLLHYPEFWQLFDATTNQPQQKWYNKSQRRFSDTPPTTIRNTEQGDRESGFLGGDPLDPANYSPGTKIYLSAIDCRACTPQSQRNAVNDGALAIGEPAPGKKLYRMREYSKFQSVDGKRHFPRTLTIR